MMILISSIVSSLFVYFVLSYLSVTQRVTIPVSFLMFTLIFGLTRYYSTPYNQNDYACSGKSKLNNSSQKGISIRNENKENELPSIILFLTIFVIVIVTCALISKTNFGIFMPWNKFDGISLIQLGAAIALSFFLPGYAVVLILTKNHKINLVLKVLVAYIFSMLITGLTIYFTAIYLDGNISESKIVLISVYIAIITVLIVHYRTYRIILTIKTTDYHSLYYFISNIGDKLMKVLEVNISELIVFASLFGLLIIYTYYVYGGITIGDQWYHQNRAFLFLFGHFKEVVLSSGDSTYPPLQSALLAGLTTLSGTPLVNAYASIAFLNMTAVFAFYYFCSTWFPANEKRAALLASTLFLLGSGFGWIYILDSMWTSPTFLQNSTILPFLQQKIRSSDIILSANFMIAAFPDFSTALIYISLPAGFLLLGLVRRKFNNKYAYTATLSILSSAGILFHEEFYIFIIVSCILPLAFNIRDRNSVYLAFLFSFTFVYMIDAILPVRYFTSNEILGMPLITLNVFFVIIMWTLYATQQKLRSTSISLVEFTNRVTNYVKRISFIPKVIVVWAVIYLCALSFIVWTQLPSDYVQAHTKDFTAPWYLYPFRLGVIGLFGLAYVLTYLFKRFEKEVFVFGIMVLVAFLAGPYYNEHRFSKYIMVGMIGFASLIIYKLLIFRTNEKPLINGTIIGLIVISASFSTLMFIGYNALVIQNQDYAHALARRNFPSAEEMNMLELMRSKIQVGSNIFNVASFPNQYDLLQGGIITKLHAFSELPITKIEQSPLTLNSSTLDSFYHLLDISNTKYIIMPKDIFKEKELTDPIQFALDNFQHTYEDNNYLILEVPALRGPSTISDTKVAITYKKDKTLFPTASNKPGLLSNATFELQNDSMKFIKIQKGNQSEKVTLYGYKNIGGKTVWSKNLYSNDKDAVNYIQAKFRVLAENKTGKDSVGIKWREGNKVYVVYLTRGGLELRQAATNNNNKPSLLFQNAEIDKNDGIWYLLKVASLKDSISIYLNDELKIKVPRTPSEEITGSISKVGINAVNNAVEFEPIQIGKIPLSEQFYDKKNDYDYYYPLSMLALSQSGYSTFTDDDYSVFSKKYIVLPFDPQDWSDSKFNEYLNYARSGGTLVVMNSDDNFNGRFGKLFSVTTSNKTTKYTYILVQTNPNTFLNVSGMVKNVEIEPSTDESVIATYRNEDNNAIAPFVIEKSFPSGGKIMLVNDKAYFDTIYSTPRKYFPTLQNLTGLFYINPDKSVIPQRMAEPTKRFIGDMKMSGEVSINSSSFSLINRLTNTSNLNSEAISIFDKDKNMNGDFKNVSIVDMKLFGRYEVYIDSIGNLALPSETSQYDYIKASLPNGFNMTIKLLDKGSHAAIVTKQKSSLDSIKVDNESKIEFYKIRSGTTLPKSVPVLIKEPTIMLNGNASFKGTNFYGGLPTRNPALDIAGQVKAQIDFVDHYKDAYGNGTRSQYITYLKSITIDGETKEDNVIKVPGDIPSSAKERGLSIPLYNILSSSTNILILITSIMITLIVGWLLRRLRIS